MRVYIKPFFFGLCHILLRLAFHEKRVQKAWSGEYRICRYSVGTSRIDWIIGRIGMQADPAFFFRGIGAAYAYSGLV